MEHTALVIIDMQDGFNDPIWGKRNNPKLENNVASLLKHWRENRWPVFHIQHLSRNLKSPLHEGHSGVKIMDCAKPMGDEPIIQKNVNSCFIGTNLETILRKAGIINLVFSGIASDHCVSTSTRMAANLGFNCYVASDATTSFDRKDQNGTTYPGDLVHSISLASLHGEFATVVNTRNLIEKGNMQ